MRIQWVAAAICSTLLVTGCASSQSDSGMGNAKASIVEPEITITQVSTVSEVARNITGGFPVKFQMKVENKAKHPITLKRVELQSVGYGAYDLGPSSIPFQKEIASDGEAIVEFFIPAHVTDATISGANGPVTLRAVAQFDSNQGQFQHMWVQQVHEFGSVGH
ncbi:MAG: hypothetical protein ABI837_00100 [Acidobacteriota bacterium]